VLSLYPPLTSWLEASAPLFPCSRPPQIASRCCGATGAKQGWARRKQGSRPALIQLVPSHWVSGLTDGWFWLSLMGSFVDSLKVFFWTLFSPSSFDHKGCTYSVWSLIWSSLISGQATPGQLCLGLQVAYPVRPQMNLITTFCLPFSPDLPILDPGITGLFLPPEKGSPSRFPRSQIPAHGLPSLPETWFIPVSNVHRSFQYSSTDPWSLPHEAWD